MSNGIEKIEELRQRLNAELDRVRDESAAAGGDVEEPLRQVKDLRIRQTGKKSELASLKKTIGSVPAEDRAAYAKAIQSLEREVMERLDAAETALTETVKQLEIDRD